MTDVKPILLTHKEKEVLLRRFDPSSAVKELMGWVINIPCALCLKYRDTDSCTCGQCPAYSGGGRCSMILENVRHLQMNIFNVFWRYCNNEEARKELAHIYQYIEKCPIDKKEGDNAKS